MARQQEVQFYRLFTSLVLMQILEGPEKVHCTFMKKSEKKRVEEKMKTHTKVYLLCQILQIKVTNECL